MEAGDYPTNVLSINDLTSIHYHYLEPAASRSHALPAALRNIESSWRSEGALVVCDPSKVGIWLFGIKSNSGPDALLPASAVVDVTGTIEAHGVALTTKMKGTFDTANIAKTKASIHATPNTQGSTTPSSAVMESPFRLMQNNQRSAQASPTPTPTASQESTTLSIYKAENTPLELSPGPLPREMHERFVSAILAGLVYRLCSHHGYVGLNSRTLLSPPRDFDSDASLVTLDVHLTSLGNLILKASPQLSSGLSPVVDAESGISAVPEGRTVWLAPGGMVGRYLGREEALSSDFLASLDTGSRQRPPTLQSIERWKAQSRTSLALYGLDMSAIESSGWLLIQIPCSSTSALGTDGSKVDRDVSFSVLAWPAKLCFQRRIVASDRALDNHSQFQADPLSFAEDWFVRSVERDATVKKRQKDREAEAAKEQGEADAKVLPTGTFSPMALRRTSIAGGVYPTPPDGVLNPIGATPSMDGNVSTPGNANLPQVTSEPEPPAPKEETNDPDAELWGGTRPDAGGSSLQFNDNDDVFPDLNTDLFGDNAVTDADFNFFDEPDDRDTAGDDVLDDIQPDNQLDTNANLEVVEEIPSAADAEAPAEVDITLSDPPAEEPKEEPVKVLTPLNPESLQRKLFPDTEVMDVDASKRWKRSAFDAVAFGPSLTTFGQKYGSGGRFDVSKPVKLAKRPNSITIPRTEYLTRRLSRRGLPPRTPVQDRADDYDETGSQSDATSVSSSASTSLSEEESSQVDHFAPLLSAGVKRKRVDDDETSFSTQDLMVEKHKSSLDSADMSPTTPLFNPDPAEWSLADIFAYPEPSSTFSAASDADFIATAQVLTDQAMSTTLRFSGLPDDAESMRIANNRLAHAHAIQKDFASATKAYISDISQCHLTSYLEIQDLASQLSRMVLRPMANPQRPDVPRPANLIAIPPPHLQVRRADSKLAILPPAIQFWENLGLAASDGGKAVSAVCVFFDGDGMELNASIFLDHVQRAYESCRLGSHTRMDIDSVTNGLMAIDTANAGHNSVLGRQAVLTATKDAAARLAKSLTTATLDGTNVVVYFVYPTADSELLVHICYAFQHLFEVYKGLMRQLKLKPTIELVLQLVPRDFITSPTKLEVPEPSDYINFAHQVYDRSTDFTAHSSPSITLEEMLPRSIEFKLTATPSASLMLENSCMQVAYAQSIDERWVSVAWSDSVGRQQTTASYCLGRRNSPILTSFADVAHEIWETTIGIISRCKVTWRVQITKVGVMERAEIEFWKQMSAQETNAQINLILVTVDTQPSLHLIPPAAALPPGAFSAQSGAYSTPVSTPQQSSFVSPDAGNTPTAAPTPTSSAPRDAISNAPTPGTAAAQSADGELDPDAVLVDALETTWAAVLSHRLNNARSLLEVHPALVSGYLIKRASSSGSAGGGGDAPAIMEVNIVHCDANPRLYDALLRDVLAGFRCLNTLARARRAVHPARDVRPWHIAAAEKAVHALYLLM